MEDLNQGRRVSRLLPLEVVPSEGEMTTSEVEVDVQGEDSPNDQDYPPDLAALVMDRGASEVEGVVSGEGASAAEEVSIGERASEFIYNDLSFCSYRSLMCTNGL